jgi:methylmalonyl-CoA/ethylmalonyl-CoA epimerase
MAKIIKINHIAIAVNDIDAALIFWQDAMGLVLDHIQEEPSQKALVAFIPLGDSEIELIKPTADDTGVAKFLSEKGPGMHHLCFEVDDISGMLKKLSEKGVRLINNSPVELKGRKIAFVHPKSTGGVLVELFELTT